MWQLQPGAVSRCESVLARGLWSSQPRSSGPIEELPSDPIEDGFAVLTCITNPKGKGINARRLRVRRYQGG